MKTIKPEHVSLRDWIEHNIEDTCRTNERYNRLQANREDDKTEDDPVYKKLYNCALKVNDYTSFYYRAYSDYIVMLFADKLSSLTNRWMKEEDYYFYVNSSEKKIIKKMKDDYLEGRRRMRPGYVDEHAFMKSNIKKNIRHTKNTDDNKFLLRCTITNNIKGVDNDPVFQKMHECVLEALDIPRYYGPTYGGYVRFYFVNYKINGYKSDILRRKMNEKTYNYLLTYPAEVIVNDLIKKYEKKHKELYE